MPAQQLLYQYCRSCYAIIPPVHKGRKQPVSKIMNSDNDLKYNYTAHDQTVRLALPLRP